MSENLNCSNPDFSKYDSMSIGELEEILRADAIGSERDDSDVDEILYVMEVLAKKRRQNGVAGKTALEAYQEFQQHYLPVAEKEAAPIIIPFCRIATVAACLILVFSLTTTANAFGWKNIWNAVAKWAEETFYFCTGVEVSEPKAEDTLLYDSLSDAIAKLKFTIDTPTYIPEGFILSDVIVDRSPKQVTILAIYKNENNYLKISVQSFLEGYPEQVEMSGDFSETYIVDGTDYYLFSNHNQAQAVWIINTYECYISGELSIDEIKLMIDSIGKG